jgi:NOL1/NOP2/sun family putative RNA methylase
MSLDLTNFERYRPLIDDWPAFEASLGRPQSTCLWANPLRTTPAQLTDIFTADDIPVEPIGWYPGGFKAAPDFKPGHHWAYLAGLYHVQEEASMLPVQLLDPQPGERILDLCAAPGGKTAQIAVWMQNTGTVVANDINFGRMRATRHALERLGLVNVSTTVENGTNYPLAAGQFDRVLVDAPCSCEGTSRKDPAVIGRVGVGVSCKKSGLQLALLRKAGQLCRPGGRIVYATCTYAPEENELVVDAFLRGNSKFRIANVSAKNKPKLTNSGLVEWQGQTLTESMGHCVRVWPHHNDTGGFFVAVLEKDTAAPGREEPPGCVDFSPVPDDLLQPVAARFGFQRDELSRYALFQRSRRKTHLANAAQQPPLQPPPDSVGMEFLKTRTRYPKLSTAAAMLLGPHARQNVIDLEPPQMWAFVTRQTFSLSAAQIAQCTGEGYVLARYRGFVLGVGVMFPRPDGAVMQSMYPKGWSPTKGRPAG